jgi:prepilin-type N-terminal cleavage/methylation domain-containing protein
MNTCQEKNRTKFARGFSLVEMLASVAIIGVIAFLAIPSVSRMRQDSERNLAIARAEALNVAMATMVQMKGRAQAQTDWSNATTADAKYISLLPYLSFAETTRAGYFPSGYDTIFGPTITDMRKVRLFGADGVEIFY